MSSHKIKVLVVDDSYLMRLLICDLLSSFEDIEIVGTARNGKEAVELVSKLKPDVVTLDYEMPVMDGIKALEEIMKKNPTPCIMLSAYTKEGAEITLNALSKGAFDFITKPSGSLSMDIEKVRVELYKKIKMAKKISPEKLKLKEKEPHKKLKGAKKISAIGIVSSTGGPPIVEYILKYMPKINIPIFIVQHMPRSFTFIFAERLNKLTKKKVKEARDREQVKEGIVYIAPGGIHMSLKKIKEKIYIYLIDEEPKWGVKPSGDYLLNAMADIYKDKSLAVILTGMGKDGSEGAKKIKEKKGILIAQDEKSSVIYGMPKAVKDIADFVLPPNRIVEKIIELA